MSDPAILDKMSRMNWHHGPSDSVAQEKLENRITESARRKSQLFYSELVQGVVFSVEGPDGVRDHVIDEWADFDRALIGDHLGYLNYRWYERAGILPASIVVRKDQGDPGPGYFNFLREIGMLTGRNKDKMLDLWVREVNKVYDHFS